jgi:hypothetical protein
MLVVVQLTSSLMTSDSFFCHVAGVFAEHKHSHSHAACLSLRREEHDKLSAERVKLSPVKTVEGDGVQGGLAQLFTDKYRPPEGIEWEFSDVHELVKKLSTTPRSFESKGGWYTSIGLRVRLGRCGFSI